MVKKFIVYLTFFSASFLAFAQTDKRFDSAARKAAMEDYEGALADIQEAIANSPKLTKLYLMRGMIYYAQGLKSLADLDFEKIVSEPAQDFETLRMRALASGRLRNMEARDAAFNEILQKEPEKSQEFLAYAVALMNFKRFDEAVAMCDRAIEKDEKNLQAYVMRAALKSMRLKDRSGYEEAAIADYNKALSLDPDNPEILYLKGRLLLEAGKREEAIETLQKVAQAYPNSGRVQRLYLDAQRGK